MHRSLDYRYRNSLIVALVTLVLSAGCSPPESGTEQLAKTPPPSTTADDVHSFARPKESLLRHLSLDLTVDFESKTLSGSATLEFEPHQAERIHLDTRDLTIERVVDRSGWELEYTLGEPLPHLGSELTVELASTGTEQITIDYVTSPAAEALQWLAPSQTSGASPFLFSQSQAILARTWVPIQDTPAVRFTYDATVRVPPELLALMSAVNPTAVAADGVYEFTMPQAIPSYLLALAVGDLQFSPLGDRSGVYAEPAVLDSAAWEFADVERMITVTEELYGPYPWDRYDLLVLPPSFPFGGMENPRLTFATPTILAGDRSLVSLVAHELAHSWSGNLVTNRTWDDFWLNEGFTTYIERRIMEALIDRDYEEMLAVLGYQDLEEEVAAFGADSPDTHLVLELAGRNPDDGMTNVAYEKGALLLRTLEESVGRETWDQFILDYFSTHAFRSIDTDEFRVYLEQQLPGAAETVQLERWLNQPGVPDNAARPSSPKFDQVDSLRERWLSDGVVDWRTETENWSTHEWLHFLRKGLGTFDAQDLATLDQALDFTHSGNSEILSAWLMLTIRTQYSPADEALESFLERVGRRKFLQPLYTELASTDEGKEVARRIYARARPGYHAISVATIDEILDWGE